MHGVAFANDLVLKIFSLPYHKIGFNLIDMIESFQVKVSSVKHVVSSLFIRNLVHRALVVCLCLGNVYECRNIRLNFIERMRLDARFVRRNLAHQKTFKQRSMVVGSKVNTLPSISKSLSILFFLAMSIIWLANFSKIRGSRLSLIFASLLLVTFLPKHRLCWNAQKRYWSDHGGCLGCSVARTS